jgi:Tfp pilus assembly protein PilX
MAHARTKNNLCNERGIALVIALGVMILLTILGVWVLNTSSTDLRIAGNTRNYQLALYYAETGLEYAKTPGLLKTAYNAYLQNTVLHPTYSWTSSISTSITPTGNTKFIGIVELPAASSTASSVTEANTGESSSYKGLFYIINSFGTSNNAKVVIQDGIQEKTLVSSSSL